MFGVLLESIATFFQEVADIIGRKEIKAKQESIYTMGFLQMFWALVIFILLVLVRQDAFYFSPASLPTFGIRVVLEVIQVFVTLVAVVQADRSTFGFLRVLTIPALLLVDLGLGYQIAPARAIGMSLVVIAMLVLFMDHNFSKKGWPLVLFGSLNAVGTISLYKYNITHFNSVAAEQIFMHAIMLAFLMIGAVYITREHPFKMLLKPVFFTQSFANGLGSLVESFAYTYAPASVIVATKRSSAVLWATLSGNLYFKERHILVKLFMFLTLTAGIILIIL